MRLRYKIASANKGIRNPHQYIQSRNNGRRNRGIIQIRMIPNTISSLAQVAKNRTPMRHQSHTSQRPRKRSTTRTRKRRKRTHLNRRLLNHCLNSNMAPLKTRQYDFNSKRNVKTSMTRRDLRIRRTYPNLNTTTHGISYTSRININISFPINQINMKHHDISRSIKIHLLRRLYRSIHINSQSFASLRPEIH